MNFNDYKFRASALPNFLSDGRSKDGLSGTCKDYLRAEWIFAMFKRQRFVTTKYMAKGTIVESDSLSLVQEVTNNVYFKNKEKFYNDFTMGTPDVVEKDFILDIKSSWDIYSFAAVDADKAYKDYYGQLLGYMDLTGRKHCQIAYCLVNTPDHIIEKEIVKLISAGVIKETDEEIANVRYSMTFDDIAPKLRLKIFDFDFEDETKAKLIERISTGREYMNSILSL